jgi:hypothetical protein
VRTMNQITRAVLLCCLTGLTVSCDRPAAESPSSISASALQSEGDIELVISGKGFTPRAEVEIKIRNYPGRIGEIVRGTTADTSGSFIFRESFAPLTVDDPYAYGDVIISAWDTSGGVPPAVTSKPVVSFVAASSASPR